MNNREINELIETLSLTTRTFENYMIEQEGEFDDNASQMEEQIEVLKELLTTEGIDSLGRWLKAKEDEVKSIKAEKDYITRRIKACEGTIDYIKTQMERVLKSADLEEIKGSNGYKFARTTSVKTEVNKETLKAIYQERVEKALRESYIIPDDVTITLGASVSALPEGAVLPVYYNRTETPSVRFTKPRAKKE